MDEEMVLEKTLIDRLMPTNHSLSRNDLVRTLNSLESPEITFLDNEMNTSININKSGYICHIPADYPIENVNIFNLDPGTAGALIAGLGAILAWVSTERRHKENMANNQPPLPPVEEKTYSPHEESCSHKEENLVCGLRGISRLWPGPIHSA